MFFQNISKNPPPPPTAFYAPTNTLLQSQKTWLNITKFQ